MLLAIDVGNTNTEFGVFEGENLLGSFRMMTKSNATSDEIGLLVCQYFQRFGLDRTRLEAVTWTPVCATAPWSPMNGWAQTDRWPVWRLWRNMAGR